MQQWYNCPRCRRVVKYGINPCPNCKCSLDWSQKGPILYKPPIGAPQQQAILSSANLPTKKKPSKLLYLGTSIIAFIAGWIIIALFQSNTTIATAASLICYGYTYIMFAILLYKAWCIFPSLWSRALPGKAVGFLFIPLFGYLWAYPVIYGFAKAYNAFITENHNVKYKISETIFLIFCVLNIITLISYFGRSLLFFLIVSGFSAVIAWVLLLMMINQMCNAINAINILTYSNEIQTQSNTVQ